MNETDKVITELDWFRTVLQKGGKVAEYYEAQSDILTKAIKLLERSERQIDSETILKVTIALIGETEPYGDSAIDRERTENLDKLIYVVEELLSDVEKVAYNKDRYEGSMRMMGEKAHKALNDWWSWINAYLNDYKGENE